MSDNWVDVGNFNWLHEAQFVKSVLESEGIAVQLPDEHVLGVQPFYAPALGGVRVLVPAQELVRATEILAAVQSGPRPVDADSDEGQ